MSEELYGLYEHDPDFKRYVDEWCRKHDLKKEQVFELNVLKEYEKWLKENKK